MVVHMSIYDKVYESGLHEVAEMDGLDTTQFMNDIYNDYKMCKDLRQTRMEAFYFELLAKLIKDHGN